MFSTGPLSLTLLDECNFVFPVFQQLNDYYAHPPGSLGQQWKNCFQRQEQSLDNW